MNEAQIRIQARRVENGCVIQEASSDYVCGTTYVATTKAHARRVLQDITHRKIEATLDSIFPPKGKTKC